MIQELKSFVGKDNHRPVYLVLLTGVIAFAAVLRLWGIDFGLPFTYHVDEPTYVSAALNLGAGRIGRQLSPPFFANLLFLEYGAYYIVERISGGVSSVAEFENLYRLDPSIFFLLGRLTTAVMGILNVLIISVLGWRSSGRRTGILAALFLSLAFLHVRDSHFAVPDLMMSMLVSLCILFGLLAMKSADRKYLYLTAFFAGSAITSKWSAWPLMVPLGYIVFLTADKAQGRIQLNRAAASAGGVLLCLFAAGFFLPSFQLLLKPGDYLAYALVEFRSGDSGGFGVWQVDTVPGYIFYLKTLGYGVGVFLLVFGILGFLRHIRMIIATHNESSVLLILFPLIYYAFMGGTRHYFARYALPLIPFLVLFSAEAIVALAAWFESKRKKSGRVLLSLLILTVSAQPLLSSLRFDYLMTQVDTRTIAKYWIEENIPKGSRIALDWPIHTPPVDAENYSVTIENKLGLANYPIDHYQQGGFDYLITSSFVDDIPLVIAEMDAERRDFYVSLDDEFDLIKVFKPTSDSRDAPFIFDEIYGPFTSLWQRERPGPILKIYRVKD